MPFTTYILYSKKLDKYYIGSTGNIHQRMDYHNNGYGKFTKKGTPWILLYQEQYDSRSEAVKREMSIKKKKSRRYIEWLINPKD